MRACFLSVHLWPFEFLERHAISAVTIPAIVHFVDALVNDVDAESGIARAVEARRRRRGGVKRIAEMMQPDGNVAWKSLGFQVDPLIGAAMVGMFYDVAGSFVDRQLESQLTVLVDRRPRQIAAKPSHEFTSLSKIAQVAVQLDLRARGRKLPFFHPNRHDGQVVG